MRTNAIRLLEPWLPGQLYALARLNNDSSPEVQLQLALTYGQIADASAIPALAGAAARNLGDRYVRSAVVSGLGGRELAFLEHVMTDGAWRQESSDRRNFLASLAKGVTRTKHPSKVLSLLDAVVGCDAAWHKRALLDGMVAGLPKPKIRAGSIKLSAEPASLAKLGDFSKQCDALRTAMTWPSKAAGTRPNAGRPLTKSEKSMVRRGRMLFLRNCMSCHQADGNGLKGMAPSLHGSPLVLGPPDRQISIVLKGIKHNAELYSQVMQGLPKLRDKELAAILTFTRRSWGHKVEPVTAAQVKKVRKAIKARTEPYSREELDKMR